MRIFITAITPMATGICRPLGLLRMRIARLMAAKPCIAAGIVAEMGNCRKICIGSW